MRVLLVGSSTGRARTRAQLVAADIEVVEEFASLAAARASGSDVDGIVIAPEHIRDLVDGEIEMLTPREVQVLELLAEGLSNKAIAERLAISDQTVKFHVSAICGKFGAANRTDAVRRAVRRGLITL
jgi:DNA-binding NarL/FixJ family response regulator